MAETPISRRRLLMSSLLLLALLLLLLPMISCEVVRGRRLGSRGACDEIYVVGEGETLHTIGDKCGDPFIVERNPHIHDPDDVFPGLVILILPFSASGNTPN